MSNLLLSYDQTHGAHTWIWRIIGIPEITQLDTHGWVKDLIMRVTLNIEDTTIHAKTPPKTEACHVGIKVSIFLYVFLCSLNLRNLRDQRR